MSKQDILDYFSDINYAYNDSTRLDTLSRMLDELVEQAASPWHRVEESPKKYGTYIVYWKDGEKFWWEKADWDEDWCTEEPNWYLYRDGRATIIEPDYWMPIEPPKEDA